MGKLALVCCLVCAAGTAGVIGYATVSDTCISDSVCGTLHAAAHAAGVCSDADCPTKAIVASDGSTGCAYPKATAGDLAALSPDELKIVDYVTQRILEDERIPDLNPDQLAEATGASLEGLNEARMRAAVLVRLNEAGFAVGSLLAGTGCARFSACSIDRNLAGATGAELARYSEEKKQDGRSFDDWSAPDFTLPRTDGEAVTLSELRGRPVAVAFLSGHCQHSFEALPHLDALQKRHAGEIDVIPVYVNSGSVEDIRETFAPLGLSLPLAVSESRELAEDWEFRMVPSVFLLDSGGRVLKKLVGQKSREELDTAFSELATL